MPALQRQALQNRESLSATGPCEACLTLPIRTGLCLYATSKTPPASTISDIPSKYAFCQNYPCLSYIYRHRLTERRYYTLSRACHSGRCIARRRIVLPHQAIPNEACLNFTRRSPRSINQTRIAKTALQLATTHRPNGTKRNFPIIACLTIQFRTLTERSTTGIAYQCLPQRSLHLQSVHRTS